MKNLTFVVLLGALLAVLLKQTASSTVSVFLIIFVLLFLLIIYATDRGSLLLTVANHSPGTEITCLATRS